MTMIMIGGCCWDGADETDAAAEPTLLDPDWDADDDIGSIGMGSVALGVVLGVVLVALVVVSPGEVVVVGRISALAVVRLVEIVVVALVVVPL